MKSNECGPESIKSGLTPTKFGANPGKAEAARQPGVWARGRICSRSSSRQRFRSMQKHRATTGGTAVTRGLGQHTRPKGVFGRGVCPAGAFFAACCGRGGGALSRRIGRSGELLRRIGPHVAMRTHDVSSVGQSNTQRHIRPRKDISERLCAILERLAGGVRCRRCFSSRSRRVPGSLGESSRQLPRREGSAKVANKLVFACATNLQMRGTCQSPPKSPRTPSNHLLEAAELAQNRRRRQLRWKTHS